MYGLKQASRAWFSKLDSHLQQQGYKTGATNNDRCMKIKNKNMIIVVVYVDYLIFGSELYLLSKQFSIEMKKEFEMSMLGKFSFCLGLQVSQTTKGIFILKKKYIKDNLKKFKMDDSKLFNIPMVTRCKLSKDDESLGVDKSMYRSMIGSFLYVIDTRSDIMQAIGLVSKLKYAPKEAHILVFKTLFGYLKGTIGDGIWYPRGRAFTLTAFTDAD